MIIETPQLNKTLAEKQFAAWLTTQKSANGKKFKSSVASSYARNLRTEPLKLDIPLSLSDRDVFRCRTTTEFDTLNCIFQTAANYREVNRKANHGAFSAGLAVYRRYLQCVENDSESVTSSVLPETYATLMTVNEERFVDFAHPEFCSGCNPVRCMVEGNEFYGDNWRDILVALTEAFLHSKPRAAELYRISVYPNGKREFLLKDKPELSTRQLSNGYWINVNLSIKDLVFTIGKLCKFCGVDLNDVMITYVPKQDENLCADDHAEVFNRNTLSVSKPTIPDAVVDLLKGKYVSGFRFDTTYVNLLSSDAGVEVDAHIQTELKHIMFRRKDDIFFLLDTVAEATVRKEILDFSDAYLKEYGCFEISELYKPYEGKINSNCIRNVDDFEDFYLQIGNDNIRGVQAPNIGNRIARYNSSAVWSTLETVAAKIVSFVTEEQYGSCNEYDLRDKFSAFSSDLLGKIIKQCAAEKLIRVEINESICYQTFEALGLPTDFSDMIAEVLGCLGDIGLEPTQDALHTTLSLKLGVNFRMEYNLPDWDTFRRLIAFFYQAEPRREWKNNIFGKVTN